MWKTSWPRLSGWPTIWTATSLALLRLGRVPPGYSGSSAGVKLDDVKLAIDSALARFEENGFLDRDLTRIKTEQETDFYNGI